VRRFIVDCLRYFFLLSLDLFAKVRVGSCMTNEIYFHSTLKQTTLAMLRCVVCDVSVQPNFSERAIHPC
jgi:hypothetical protein